MSQIAVFVASDSARNSASKVDVTVTPGSHASEHQVNKQLNDKERVAAALENSSLLEVVNRCLAHAKLAAAS